ncbi:MAG: DUF2586 family protein [Bacteroidota bacterium]
MNDVVFIKRDGGLVRTAPGEDHISGLLFYGTPPADFGADSVQQVFSLREAEALGIVADNDATRVMHYHIAEFFRTNASGALWVGIFDTAPTDFAEVFTMQTEADGRIRQLGVFVSDDFAETQVNSLQAQAELLETAHQPLSVLLGANFRNTDLASLADLTLPNSSNFKVSVVVGEDGGALGSQLATATNQSVTCLGACLGTISSAQVHENIGWVQEYNVVTSPELDTLAFATGDAYKGVEQSQLDDISNKGYIFLRKHIGISGSYFNDSYTASDPTSDFAFIENNRTVDKAIRGMRSALIPQLNSPLRVNGDGTLAFDTVKAFERLGNRPLEEMRKDGELSDYDVAIDENQDVLSSSELLVNVQLVPVGVARVIKVEVSFAARLEA